MMINDSTNLQYNKQTQKKTHKVMYNTCTKHATESRHQLEKEKKPAPEESKRI